jgi:hypothetical protein
MSLGTYAWWLRTGSPDVRQKSRIAKRRKNMDRYLIETPHTAEECLDLIKVLNAQGYLWNFDWGCKAGIHSGWAIIEAENDAEARLAVPPLVRTRARIVKLNKFDGSTIEDCEKQEAGVTRCAAR